MLRIDLITDYTPAVLNSKARAQGVKIITRKINRTCVRCGGKGYYPSKAHGACFRCGGVQTDPVPESAKYVVDDMRGVLFVELLRKDAAVKADARAAECERINLINKERREDQKLKDIQGGRKNREIALIKLEAISDIVEALKNSGVSFGKDIATSFENGVGVYGRGVLIASEIAAKQITGKSRMCKAVSVVAVALAVRINKFNES